MIELGKGQQRQWCVKRLKEQGGYGLVFLSASDCTQEVAETEDFSLITNTESVS